MKLMLVNMFFDCSTTVLGTNQSIFLHLRGSWRGTKPVYRATLCIMDKLIKIGRWNSGWRPDTKAKAKMWKDDFSGRLCIKSDWWCQTMRRWKKEQFEQREIDANNPCLSRESDCGCDQKLFHSGGRWYIGIDAAVLEHISTAVAYSLMIIA